jgi:hypothetical protein
MKYYKRLAAVEEEPYFYFYFHFSETSGFSDRAVI